MSHYKPYPAYKDSGVEWLGQVPEGWSVVPLKWLATIQNGKDYKAVETGEGGFPVIGSGGEFARASQYLFNGESVLLGRKGTIDRPLHINGAFWTVDTMYYTVIGPKVVGKYLYYCSLTIQFDRYSTNTALPSMTQEVLGQIPFALPSIEVQREIVAHIDRETARIDGLVSRKTRFIELLSEKRQALITHAVTKGLNPDAPMKDSGVEWLGEVPEGWELTYIKRVISSISQGWSPECEARPADDDEWAVLKVGCVNGGKFRSTENKALPKSLSPKPELGLKKGDVLVSRANTRELVGGCAVIPQNFPQLMICDKLYRLIVNKKVLPEFLAALISVYGRREIEVEANGASASMVNIAQSVILNLQVALPLRDEQTLILDFLDRETTRIDTLISKTERSIELLKERRSALITAAVTGQIDLRETI
jgi:type I restriction enzyme S subunit